ncbi:Uncharacterised protein [Streptococcus pneumoniae]|nr:Uncharacterised protein [Streptococcus pneumoniae]
MGLGQKLSLLFMSKAHPGYDLLGPTGQVLYFIFDILP